MMKCHVYIMANSNNTVLYTGVTSDLKERVNQHKSKKHRIVSLPDMTYANWFIMKGKDQLVMQLKEKNKLREDPGRKKLTL